MAIRAARADEDTISLLTWLHRHVSYNSYTALSAEFSQSASYNKRRNKWRWSCVIRVDFGTATVTLGTLVMSSRRVFRTGEPRLQKNKDANACR